MNDIDNFSFIPYLIDHGTELKKFSEDVNVLTSSALTQLQRLPISLRRRAASHKVNRLPFRFRKMATVSIKKKFKLPCRKYRRRHMDIKAIFAARQLKNKWLYTHMWHTKRFRIDKKWGWKVPIVPNLKTFRPCTKAMTSGSAILDITYYSSYELWGRQIDIVEGLKALVIRDEKEDIIKELLEGKEVYTVIYEHGRYPYGAICPLKMIRVGDKSDESDSSSILITVHPAAAEEVVAAITTVLSLEDKSNGCWSNTDRSVALLNRGGETSRFRLFGSDSHRIITTLLGDSAEISVLGEWPLTEVVSGHSVEALVNDPERSKPRLKQTDPEPWSTVPWRTRDELPAVILAQSYFKMAADLRQSLLNGQSIAIDRMKHLEAVIDGEKCPVRLTRHRYGGNAPGGWDVVVPSKWSMKVWTSLIMKGCRPIGLRYWSRYCAVECTSSVARYDCYPLLGWPETRQGVSEAMASAATEEGAWRRRPAAKRVNYALQATEHPFRCPYESLVDGDWFVVRDKRFISRVAAPLICGDINATAEQLDRCGADMRRALVSVTVDCLGAAVHRCATIMAAVDGDTAATVLEQPVGDGPLVRPLLGFVDEADQSMRTGKCRGTGLVSLLRIVDSSHGRPIRGCGRSDLCWIKDPSERRLVPATIAAAIR